MGDPSGGAPPGDPRRPAWRRQWPLAAVFALVAIGLVLTGLQYVRRGPALIGVAALLGAVLRLVLPEEAAGFLAVRRRAIDVAVLAILGLAIIAITLTIRPLS